MPAHILLLSLSAFVAAPHLHTEQGACPFECCRYGKWTSTETLPVYARADRKAAKLGEIPPGTAFDAVTGFTRTVAGTFRFTRSHGDFRAGEQITVYNYLGEGNCRAWRNGRMTEVSLPVSPFGGRGSEVGEMVKPPAQSWWVQVVTPQGKRGWVLIRSARNLDGADGCA